MNSRHQHLAFFATILLVCGAGLLAWRHVGIYPDEISFRVELWRYLPDHGTIHGLYSLCSSRVRQVPALFAPSALVYSVLDLAFDPTEMRCAYGGLLLCTYFACLLGAWKCGGRRSAALLTASVAGVGGSALVMVRYEAALTAALLACLVGALCVGRSVPSRLGAAAAVVFTALTSLYSHPQGLAFVPLSMLVTYWLLAPVLGRAACAAAVVLLFGFAVRTSLAFHTLTCPEYPALQAFWVKAAAGSAEGVLAALQHLDLKWSHYARTFIYTITYQAEYLPGVRWGADAESLIGAVRWWAVANAAVLTTVAVLLGICVAALLHVAFDLLRPATRRTLASPQALIGRWMPLLLAGPAFALVLVDAQQNFYRIAYLNLLLAVAATLYAATIPLRPLTGRALAALMLTTSIGSLVANEHAFGSRLLDRQGPSVSLRTDWPGLDAQVHTLMRRCGVGAGQRGIIFDDFTYNSLKRHEHLVPLTYVSLQRGIVGMGVAEAVERSKTGFVLAKCKLMAETAIGWTPDAIEGELCCKALEAPR